MVITFKVAEVQCKIDTKVDSLEFSTGTFIDRMDDLQDKITNEFQKEIGLIIAKMSDKYDVKLITFKIK